jgi:hypothetical protein
MTSDPYRTNSTRSFPLRIQVFLENSPIMAIVDSGCGQELMSAAKYEELYRHDIVTGKKWFGGLRPSNVRLKSAIGEELPILGQVRVSLQMGSLTWTIDVVVVEGLSADLILGTNFLRSANLQVDFARNVIAVKGRALVEFDTRYYHGIRDVARPEVAVADSSTHAGALPIPVTFDAPRLRPTRGAYGRPFVLSKISAVILHLGVTAPSPCSSLCL